MGIFGLRKAGKKNRYTTRGSLGKTSPTYLHIHSFRTFFAHSPRKVGKTAHDADGVAVPGIYMSRGLHGSSPDPRGSGQEVFKISRACWGTRVSKYHGSGRRWVMSR